MEKAVDIYEFTAKLRENFFKRLNSKEWYGVAHGKENLMRAIAADFELSIMESMIETKPKEWVPEQYVDPKEVERYLEKLNAWFRDEEWKQ